VTDEATRLARGGHGPAASFLPVLTSAGAGDGWRKHPVQEWLTGAVWLGPSDMQLKPNIDLPKQGAIKFR